MKKPKSIKRFCPYCRIHTEHKVTQTKRKAASSEREEEEKPEDMVI